MIRTLGFPFFCEVVEEEIDQHGVDIGCFWMVLEDLATNEFDGPDAAASV